MTPREHMAKALDSAAVTERLTILAVWNKKRVHVKETEFEAARESGRAAGHAFRALELAYDREQAARRASVDMADAVERLLYSLGEYVRQAMHANREWADGIRTVEYALLRARIAELEAANAKT